MMQQDLPNLERPALPFIRWAGGKSWLVSRLRHVIPRKFNNYHEPFLGGGAMFFAIMPPNKAFLSDANRDLINAYKQLKRNPESVIEHLKSFGRSESAYYKIRSAESDDKFWLAARFIYLNKMSYNGIYRVNRHGVFNVPYGHNDNAPIYDRKNLSLVSKNLKKAKILCQDFAGLEDKIEKNDFLFLDPPYTVAHSNNGFIEYNQRLFTWKDQIRLADFISLIRKRKAKFVLTNAFHESVEKQFGRLGNIHEIPRSSTVTSIIEKRSLTKEYLITNCF